MRENWFVLTRGIRLAVVVLTRTRPRIGVLIVPVRIAGSAFVLNEVTMIFSRRISGPAVQNPIIPISHVRHRTAP